MTLPLSGTKVLDLSRVFAGPYCTQNLADLGAEVIKVERPGNGDEMRNYGPPFLRDTAGNETRESAYYLAANRNKRAITVEMSTPEGQDIIRRLAAQSDVLVENYKVGDLARHGLDYASVRTLNPGIIYCSITGYGQTGPYKQRPGLDGTFQALGGMMSITGEPDGPPVRVGVIFADLMTAMYASLAITAALHHRAAHGGPGQYIDMALMDTQVAALSHRAQYYLVSGEIPPRIGSGTPASVPSQTFACTDGTIFVSAATDLQFPRFCDAIGRPDLLADPRFATRDRRYQNKPDLIAIVAPIIAGNSMHFWAEHFAAANVVCSPVNNIRQVFEDPQVQHRDMLVAAPHPLAGTVQLLRNPIRYSETPLTEYAAPPIQGQHTEAVLRERLGMTPDAIAALRQKGVI